MAQKKITMIRDGQVRKFSPATVAAWPDHRYGWEPLPQELPQAVAKNMQAAPNTAPDPAPTRGRKPKQNGDPLAESE